MNVIETEHLTKIYQDNYIAVNDMTLNIPTGAVFGLVGPNGAGKSTTIRLLLGLHNPTAGHVRVFGEAMHTGAVDLRQRIGFLPTNPRFPAGLNPITYLDFVGRLLRIPAETRKPRLTSLLRAVGLLGASSQDISGFSTGMITRLGIAASLMNDPELLIWDEPTSGLDPEGQKYTVDLIRELGRHKTVVVSSHNLADLKQVCTHIGILSDGKLIYNGTVAEMKQLTRSDTLALEFDGQIEALFQQITAELPHLKVDKLGQKLEVTFNDPMTMPQQLAAIMHLIAATPDVTLLTIHSLRDDMVDAFMHLLEAERSHGFARLFTHAPFEVDAILGDTGD